MKKIIPLLIIASATLQAGETKAQNIQVLYDTGKRRMVTPTMLILTILFILKFIFI